MNPINKLRYNTGSTEPLCFNVNDIAVGISSDYMLSNTYAESCFTGWYQSITSTKTLNIFGDYVVVSNKPPGGSLYFSGDSNILIDDPSGYCFLNCNDFTLEFWVYFESLDSNNVPLITNARDSSTSGYKIMAVPDIGAQQGYEFGLYLGSGSGTWDIINGPTVSGIYYPINTWHHVCLSRKGTQIIFTINGTQLEGIGVGTTCIDNLSADSKVGICRYTNIKVNEKYLFMTNLRYYIGRAKYNASTSFTPPSYPLSAIGKIGNLDSTPLLFNAFQDSKKFYNSGQRNLTIGRDNVLWSGSTPFLNDIPEIYKWSQGDGSTGFINNLRNIAVNMGDNVTFTTVSGATNWYLSKNNLYIQNFDYEDIPTSGLTYYYDPQHIMSLPSSPFAPTGSTGSSVYNLVNTGTETWETFTNQSYKNDALSTDAGYFSLQSLDITSAFTVVTIFRNLANSFTVKESLLPGVSASTGNGFSIYNLDNTANDIRLSFNIFSSSGVELNLINYSGYTLSAYTMFTITSNGTNDHHVYKNGSRIFSGTTACNRTSSNINIYWGLQKGSVSNTQSGLDFKLFCVYNRALTLSEVSRLHSELRTRMNISI